MSEYILMADIIKSRLKKAGAISEKFSELVSGINVRYADRLKSPLTITLGDEFQGVCQDLKTAAQIILEMEEELAVSEHKFKLRYIINYGPIDTEINPEIAYGMLGEGLATAREGLAELKKAKGIRVGVKNMPGNRSEALVQAFFLCTSCIDAWKPEDTALVREFLKNDDYKQVAERLNKDVSLMWRRRKSLKMDQYIASKGVINYIAK